MIKTIKDNFSQIYALTEKNLKISLRFKAPVLFSFITPLITIIMPIIIMGQFFTFNRNYGPWNPENYLVYIFIAYNILLLEGFINVFPNRFVQEKYWQTLQALIIAPFRRFNLLFGIFFAELILLAVPFSIFFIICFIYYSISVLTLIFVLLLFFLIMLIFSGLGLILGIFAISKENSLTIAKFCITIVFWFSCISYPFEIFPKIVQNVIIFNPLYYLFDVLRLAWIEDNVLLTLGEHTFGFLLLIASSVILPCFGIYIFNLIYRKYGIVGY